MHETEPREESAINDMTKLSLHFINSLHKRRRIILIEIPFVELPHSVCLHRMLVKSVP